MRDSVTVSVSPAKITRGDPAWLRKASERVGEMTKSGIHTAAELRSFVGESNRICDELSALGEETASGMRTFRTAAFEFNRRAKERADRLTELGYGASRVLTETVTRLASVDPPDDSGAAVRELLLDIGKLRAFINGEKVKTTGAVVVLKESQE